jgi:hypothetical protein
MISDFLSHIGNPEEALRSIDRAILLNPYHHDWYDTFRAEALYFMRRYSEAADTVKRVNFAQYWGHAIAAACRAMVGGENEARLMLVNSSRGDRVFPAGVHIRGNVQK